MNKHPSVVACTLWIRGFRYSDKDYIVDMLSDVGYSDSFIVDVLNLLYFCEHFDDFSDDPFL